MSDLLEHPEAEDLVGDWLKTRLNVKVWYDVDPPANGWSTAAWLWVQRGQGGETLALTLDDALLDISAYAVDADHAKTLARKVWSLMILELPGRTFGNGIFVKNVTCPMRPCWLPDPKARRGATYRVILHGLI